MDLTGVIRATNGGTEIMGIYSGNTFVWPDPWIDTWDEGTNAGWEEVWADMWTVVQAKAQPIEGDDRGSE